MKKINHANADVVNEAVRKAFDTLNGVANPLHPSKRKMLKSLLSYMGQATLLTKDKESLGIIFDHHGEKIASLIGHEPSVHRVIRELKTVAGIAKQDSFRLMVDSYIESLMWSSSISANPEDPDSSNEIPADEIPLDRHDGSIKVEATAVCTAFVERCQGYGIDTASFPPVAVGHAFALDRNGHGSGFWDHEETFGEYAKKLSEISDEFGTADVYTGDDGKLYVADYWIYTQKQADGPKP